MGRATAPLYRLRSRHSRTRRTLAGTADEARCAGERRDGDGRAPLATAWLATAWLTTGADCVARLAANRVSRSERQSAAPGGLGDNCHRERHMTKGAVPQIGRAS